LSNRLQHLSALQRRERLQHNCSLGNLNPGNIREHKPKHSYAGVELRKEYGCGYIRACNGEAVTELIA